MSEENDATESCPRIEYLEVRRMPARMNRDLHVDVSENALACVVDRLKATSSTICYCHKPVPVRLPTRCVQRVQNKDIQFFYQLRQIYFGGHITLFTGMKRTRIHFQILKS